jgi:hypothetical protein
MLNIREETFFVIDGYELDDFITKHYDLSESYYTIGAEELREAISFPVDVTDDEERWHKEDLERLMKGDQGMTLHSIMHDLYKKGILKKGKYLIDL